jgi:hypothetical protein
MPIPMKKKPDLIISGDNLRVISHTRAKPKKRKYTTSFMSKVNKGCKSFLSSPFKKSLLRS